MNCQYCNSYVRSVDGYGPTTVSCHKCKVSFEYWMGKHYKTLFHCGDIISKNMGFSNDGYMMMGSYPTHRYQLEIDLLRKTTSIFDRNNNFQKILSIPQMIDVIPKTANDVINRLLSMKAFA